MRSFPATRPAPTGMDYILGFVIDRAGAVLDGSSLARAFGEIDGACSRPPLGYMVNCSYPSFLHPREQPAAVLSRLVGFQGNASSRDHADLEGAGELHADAVSDWGRRMVELNRRFGVKILGGCCGTGTDHLRYLVDHIGDNG